MAVAGFPFFAGECVFPGLVDQLSGRGVGKAIYALGIFRQGQLRALRVIVEARLLVRGDGPHRGADQSRGVFISDFLSAGGDHLAHLAALRLELLKAFTYLQFRATVQAIEDLSAEVGTLLIDHHLQGNG
ncbi:hypothetical protein D3C84_942120 [compost metagenome]